MIKSTLPLIPSLADPSPSAHLNSTTPLPVAATSKNFFINPSELSTLGIGLSYPSHNSEMKVNESVFFEKNSLPTLLNESIRASDSLDYELEIALLLHKNEKQLFAYLLHNDFTNRRIQIHNFDESNMGPGFSKAKSFAGSNQISNRIIVGDESVWATLEAKLYLNNKLVQTLRTSENLLTPSQIHQIVFSDEKLHKNKNWVLIGTGTPSGTIFQSPNFWQKLGIFFQGFFNLTRAKDIWLSRFQFLKTGDQLRYEAPAFYKNDLEIEIR